MSSSRVLVVNAGSSSLKFKLYDVLSQSLQPVVGGLLERIGDPKSSSITLNGPTGKKEHMQAPIKNITVGLEHVFNVLTSKLSPTVRDEVKAVGHRLVHGGQLASSVVLDDNAKAELQRAATFAPLHNPAQLAAVQDCESFFDDRTQVGVFDTAFHHTMPPSAHAYAIPYDMYTGQGVRKYGMHGTSYRFLVSEAAKHLQIPEDRLNLVIGHIGSGSSMCCVKGGKSIDTSMGMTPLEGLVMGTRCGDIDPGLLPFLGEQGMSIKDIDTLMNKKSGLLGLSGHSDWRAVSEGAMNGDERCLLASGVYVHRLRKYLGAYLLQLAGECQAIVFSAGLGENAPDVRAAVCRNLETWGIEIDEEANQAAVGVAATISTRTSKVKVVVLPTDEELCIARDTAQLAGLSAT